MLVLERPEQFQLGLQLLLKPFVFDVHNFDGHLRRQHIFIRAIAARVL